MPSPCRPNVILAVLDTLSEADCGRKEAQAQMPALARLRSESALFTNAYAPCPESSPARASLFTGLDPCAHGVWTNGVALPARERTFPQILAPLGYANWLVGRRQLAGVVKSQETTLLEFRPCLLIAIASSGVSRRAFKASEGYAFCQDRKNALIRPSSIPAEMAGALPLSAG